MRLLLLLTFSLSLFAQAPRHITPKNKTKATAVKVAGTVAVYAQADNPEAVAYAGEIASTLSAAGLLPMKTDLYPFVAGVNLVKSLDGIAPPGVKLLYYVGGIPPGPLVNTANAAAVEAVLKLAGVQVSPAETKEKMLYYTPINTTVPLVFVGVSQK